MTLTAINRIIEEGNIDYDFLEREGFIKDEEDGYWSYPKLGVEYDYFSEWMWFGKEGIPRVDSQKRFIEVFNTNGAKEKLETLNKQYTLNK